MLKTFKTINEALIYAMKRNGYDILKLDTALQKSMIAKQNGFIFVIDPYNLLA